MSPEDFHHGSDTYLLSHSVGLMPRATAEWVDSGLSTTWRTDPVNAWPSWMLEIERFRSALARLFNHEAQWFCPQANISSGLTKVLHALPREPGRNVILLSASAFPSVGFVARAAERQGFALRLIPKGEDCQNPSTWSDHITNDVAVVIITHVHPNTGELIPVREVAELATRTGARTIVDVAQSAGVIPIDLRSLGVDVVVGSCVKWLCGGPGAGFLWIRPDLVADCAPLDVGWFSHDDPFEFDIGHFELAEDALRFWGGTPSVAPFSIASRSIEVIEAAGVPQIREHNQTLTTQLINSVDRALVASPLDPSLRSGTVIIDVGAKNTQLADACAIAGIHLDVRDRGLRISPHLYNTSADIDALAELVNAHPGVAQLRG